MDDKDMVLSISGDGLVKATDITHIYNPRLLAEVSINVCYVFSFN